MTRNELNKAWSQAMAGLLAELDTKVKTPDHQRVRIARIRASATYLHQLASETPTDIDKVRAPAPAMNLWPEDLLS